MQMFFVPCHSGLICVWTFASQIIDEEETQFITNCPNAVMESTPRRRTNIQVYWTAPPSGSGCVLLKYVYNNANATSDTQRQVCCLKVLRCAEHYWWSKTLDKRGSARFCVFINKPNRLILVSNLPANAFVTWCAYTRNNKVLFVQIRVWQHWRRTWQPWIFDKLKSACGMEQVICLKCETMSNLRARFRLAERSEEPRWARCRLFCDSHCVGAVNLGWHIATKADKFFAVSNVSAPSSGQYG